MTSPTQFPRLRGGPELTTRAQDNINSALGPLAEALNATPIMGASPPPWILVNLINGFTATGGGQKIPAYHIDALRYLWFAGSFVSAAGAAANTVLAILPVGCRPADIIHFAVKGNGGTAQFISVSPNGNVAVEVAVAAGAFTDVYFSFLAEQ